METYNHSPEELNREISRAVLAHRDAVAQMVVLRKYAAEPELWEPYGDAGRQKSLQDARFHITYLAEALSASDPLLFIDYLAWVKVLFKGLNFPDHVLPTTVDYTRDALKEVLPESMRGAIDEFVDRALAQLSEAPTTLSSFIHDELPLAGLAREYLSALLEGDRHTASRLVLDAVQGGADLKEIYLSVFQPAQYELGRLWQMNRISVAQEHYCTAATQLIMSQLYPYIFSTEKNGKSLIATCIGGELHEIGVRMIADFFEIHGWDTYYLGANAPAEAIVQTIRQRKADLLALSVTMTFNLDPLVELIRAVRKACGDTKVRILVGGYPFNVSHTLWRRVGADGFARNAEEAVEVGERLTGEDRDR